VPLIKKSTEHGQIPNQTDDVLIDGRRRKCREREKTQQILEETLSIHRTAAALLQTIFTNFVEGESGAKLALRIASFW